MSQISFTPAAEQYFKQYINSVGATGVRLSLKPTGCAGYSYVWDLVYDYHAQMEPIIQHQDGFVLLAHTESLDLLLGSEVDLDATQPHHQVVKVKSAKQAHACGCGESVTFHG
jgi:iron-sulfur cluster assembly accessory protein